MAESNNRFSSGKMNKDFDERLVPNNEYRDALNVQVSTSEGSDVGTLQNVLGNSIISSILGENYCVGSITDEKTDTIYWLIAGEGIDIIAEYNYITKEVLPVLVDVYPITTVAEAGSGRVLNFDRNFLITGINIVEDFLFWTDNNTEPKQINITRSKYGSPDFVTHSDFYVKNPNSTSQNPPFVAVGPVKESQITVIKKSPKIAPRLEMKNTNRGDLDSDGVIGNVITTMVISDPVGTLIKPDGGGWIDTPITLTTESVADYKIGDFIVLTPITSGVNRVQNLTSIIVEIMSYMKYIPAGGGVATYNTTGAIGLSFKAKIHSGDTTINSDIDTFAVTLKEPTPLFEFVFPRFAYRYKYMDGQYSTFSPFSEVAFLPSKFDYLPKEGYNLGMVNTLRKLAVKDFVDKNQIPEDVDSIDILYKESNSPTIYTVDSISRLLPISGKFDAWNGVGVETVSSTLETTGYFEVKSEKIHAVVPSNQLLRAWDNVPRKALGQEIIGNRLVLANYLQNYNMESARRQLRSAFNYGYGAGSVRDLHYYMPKNNNITVDLRLQHVTQSVDDTDPLVPEVLSPGSAFKYSPAKSIKSLRTYQVGVVYIDEFGRETPVFSASKNARNSVKVEKASANLQGQLKAQIFSAMPDWAKNFKFFIKESSNEYYNLAMDRWYPAQDGNIWLSFPSAERNKIDDETFLILKKGHNTGVFVPDDTKYKVLAIENEAPLFIKTRRTPKGSFVSSATIPAPVAPLPTPTYTLGIGAIGGYGATVGFPVPGGTYVSIEKTASQFIVDKILDQGLVDWQFRINGGLNGVSAWYTMQSIVEDTVSGYWEFTSKKIFGQDMNCTSSIPWSSGVGATGASTNLTMEFVKKEVRNLPEFDGRFFVKILSDSTIKENIVGEEVITSSMWTIKNSIVSQYIDPEPAYGQAWLTGNGNGLAGGSEYFGVNVDRLSIDGRDPAGYSHHGAHDGTAGGNSYWDKAGSTTNAGSSSSGWFIDKIEAFRPFKMTGGAGGWNYGGKDDDSHFTNPDAGILWKAYWSVGALVGGTSYADPDPKNQLQLIGTNTHTNPLGVNKYMNLDKLTEHGNKLRASALTYGEIIPSVGIDATENIIHLSFVGLGPDTDTGGITTLSKLKTSFDDAAWASQFVSEQAFISDIMTPGTLWRWKEDPDKIVYKSKAYSAGTMPSISPVEWQKNTYDQKDGFAGVSLYNYANFQDYGMEHKHRWEGWTLLGGSDTYVGTLAVSHWVSQGIGDAPITNLGLWSVTAAAFLVASTVGAPAYVATQIAFGIGTNPNTAGGWGGPNITTPHFKYPCMTKDWGQPRNRRRRFMIAADAYVDNDGKVIDQSTGPWGLGSTPLTGLGAPNMAYLPTNDPDLPAHYNVDGTVLNSLVPNGNVAYTDRPTTRPPGIRPDGMYTGSHSTIPGLKTNTFVANTIGVDSFTPGSVTWEIVEPYLESDDENTFTTTNPAIWETEPKENIDLDIYHEISQLYPTKLDGTNMEQFVGPIRDDRTLCTKVECWHPDNGWVLLNSGTGLPGADDIRVVSVDRPTNASGGQTGNDTHVWLSDVNGFILSGSDNIMGVYPGHVIPTMGSRLMFTREDGSRTEGTVKSQHAGMPAVLIPGTSTVIPAVPLNAFELHDDSHNYEVVLPWFNCYSFGNGVESNRIRDDYNQVYIDRGAKVSTVLEEPYMEDRRATGFIYSGIFNSTSNVNNLNQFIQAEKITKDLNPDGGSIQKLFARDTDLITLCEDKIFKVLANKDALYNADGDSQLVSTNNVLGTATTFSGDYGISTNPESFASESFRMYFADKSRGAILRLSRDGLTPISSAGMTDWFNDNLPTSKRIIGSYDDKKKEYNITLSYVDYTSYTVGILCDVAVGKGNWVPGDPMTYQPTAPGILVLFGNANKFSIGDLVVGAGIPIGSIITGKINKGGGEWWLKLNNTPDFVEVEALGLPIVYGELAVGVPPLLVTYQTRITASTPTSEPKTLTFSEQAKGWVSFKSFLQESGVSIDNEYFTFHKGNLWQHHISEVGYGSFYKQHFESSVQVLFNETPGSVKSFGVLNYEGSQSHITRDTTNSGEYWDNEQKLGWYIDNIYTDLQQGDRHEFKDKEGKWFSQIQGVTTEWLDNKSGGNLDPNEFSYQGIDDSYGVVVNGDYTSWDCTATGGGGGGDARYASLGSCVEIPGLGGSYATEADCYADTTTDCGDLCYGTEMYADSNVNVTFCNIVGTTVQTNVYITAYLDPNANYWSVVYAADNVPGVPAGTEVVDLNVYSYSGDSSPTLTLGLGTWDYTVTDSNNCTVSGGFLLECPIIIIPGCTDSTALNYDPLATTDDGSCVMPILGCIDPLATNYDPLANTDDGSCVYPVAIYGCTDLTATNYNPLATINDGSCIYPEVYGCTDSTATNYNPLATINDGSCVYCIYGCTAGASNAGYTGDQAWWDDTSVVQNGYTGTPPQAVYTSYALFTGIPIFPGTPNQMTYNYYAGATCDDGSCCFNTQINPVTGLVDCLDGEIWGCTNPLATNYDPLATIDDGSCTMPVYGCTDQWATNYDPNATIDDGSCVGPCAGTNWPSGFTFLGQPYGNTQLYFEQALYALGIDNQDPNTGVNLGKFRTKYACGVTSLNLNNKSICDLTGLEAFWDLEILNLGYNGGLTNNDACELEIIPTSTFPNLQVLKAHGNPLKQSGLDLTANTLLEVLWLNNTTVTNWALMSSGWVPLTNPDLSQNTLLKVVKIDTSNITNLDLSANSGSLTNLSASSSSMNNGLIDLGVNVDLTNLAFTVNSVSNLTVRVGSAARVTIANSLLAGGSWTMTATTVTFSPL